ncbi:precorrin-6Y C5,15-methyltransferase (decarboxylating) subunit CbiT [Clostridium saccharobutylicum]|uniref:Cobalt-precorrin-6Y C(15)-methyltransferase n=1 Tax=Clostridium saccharobutylicum DSM 13864 TaxID=1345695 RepID=U5MXM5_CLOSA|nr:precorrin-6Y C5,15-methyltransferase (decarboxylating) subunit CbiT [Clostridium saccharobutylicum]AGX44212.1 cobalt-precorrin-6Y C(15)-methyltransferase [Clostridium saccharobutylicum DSM 13864]AQR91499.1 putative cobalt-precorrin-6Y C(15)-methyltransferase [Clostridium saccharobutylicum]AQS01404.1 putative cobalt-precorrin-6Y C(15)-methyltransferase [Clostridium saccharobutylicum]AQS11013.1 putative cobalt-precorrin-6Y C(15)-methyltransferase [Clostridium saccharobutylicum]AQS15387.1 puta
MIFIKDEEFIRGKCPMTKEDIRILSIAKMNLDENSKVLDIGSGTGSITVQAAKIARNGKVVSIEKEDEPFEVTKRNIEKFNCDNIEQIKDDASNTLENIINKQIKFDSIFVGGSGGTLEDIIFKATSCLNDNGVLVMNFITLDNVYKAIESAKKLNYKVDISLINVSKNKENTLMMIANNPIYIIQCIKKDSF